jgi:hypothetical protein
MAKNTYYVVFENTTDGSTPQSPVASNKKTDNEETQRIKDLTNKATCYALVNYAESAVDMVATYRMNTVELRTGHAELQHRMQFQYGVAKKGFDIIKNMSMAGSIAGAGGVFVSGIAGVADVLVNVGMRQAEVNMRREVENTSLFFARIRAGAGQDRTGNTR